MTALSPFDLLILFIAAVAMPVASAMSGRYLDAARARSLVGRYWYIIARAVLGSALILVGWRWMGRSYGTLGLDMPVGVAGQIGFAVDSAILVYFAFMLLIRKLPPQRIATMRGRLESNRIMPETPGEFSLFPLVALAGSTFEELLYRGYLMWLLAPFAGLWGAVGLSSLFFGLGHAYQGRLGIARTALIGLGFGIGFALTHSLWWLIVAHVMVNVFGGLFARRLMRLSPVPAS
jgi:membrane protease YdiL (CAAX protease family)